MSQITGMKAMSRELFEARLREIGRSAPSSVFADVMREYANTWGGNLDNWHEREHRERMVAALGVVALSRFTAPTSRDELLRLKADVEATYV